ncbi:MAG: hypothetical protein L0Y66_03630 [Myxococcaceae bacterium]|nr:hypothetical protein [Myxococcaceae bacterium]MCI0668922.1 hypothetical protein [Myxococcaceae bacterium]
MKHTLASLSAVAAATCSLAASAAPGGEEPALLPFDVKVQAYASDVSLANLALKVGGEHIYGLATVGMQPTFMLSAATPSRWSVGLGVGGIMPLEATAFFLHADLIGSFLNEGSFIGDAKSLLGTVRLMAGFRVTDTISVFAGPTLNTLVDLGGRQWSDVGFGFIPKWDIASGATSVSAWPGATLGVQLL